MPWWLTALGAAIGGLATFVISWSALKPRQRLFATRLVTRWGQRAAVTFAICYFVWVNVSFLMKDGPVGRLELFVLLLANAEALILLIVHVFVKVFSAFLEKRNERWARVTGRLESLETASKAACNEAATLQ
ncbi:hypothetical protein [Polaromonas sp. SM01]|uniref:hypothetical protein n=1 Tax=Polaromonas sp. SM01 TaxID=3085630 RepID=UPI002982ABC3|nr:hypothetical protein [Polaromonas sp. SM01]MDW5445137.1 hypothetical protein [Polaromonas sp. SM01]